jgi:hypothetical protein
MNILMHRTSSKPTWFGSYRRSNPVPVFLGHPVEQNIEFSKRGNVRFKSYLTATPPYEIDFGLCDRREGACDDPCVQSE